MRVAGRSSTVAHTTQPSRKRRLHWGGREIPNSGRKWPTKEKAQLYYSELAFAIYVPDIPLSTRMCGFTHIFSGRGVFKTMQGARGARPRGVLACFSLERGQHRGRLRPVNESWDGAHDALLASDTDRLSEARTGVIPRSSTGDETGDRGGSCASGGRTNQDRLQPAVHQAGIADKL